MNNFIQGYYFAINALTDRNNFLKTNSNDFETYLNTKIKSSDNNKNTNYNDIIDYASKKYNLPKNLITNVIKAESDFDPNCTSEAGAKGLMQIMPDNYKELGITNPFDPYQNILGGCKMLKDFLDEFKDTRLALAAYNAGPNAVKKYGTVPPYNETQNYVKKILEG